MVNFWHEFPRAKIILSSPQLTFILLTWVFSTGHGRSSLLSKGVSSFVSFIGSLQASVTRGIMRRLLGPSWSVTAVEATCGHLLWVSSELHHPTKRDVLYVSTI